MVIESLLVKDAGYALTDLRGERRHYTEERPRTGVLAWLRSKLPWTERGTLTTEYVEETEGMTEREVMSRLVLHEEHEKMKKESAEDNARKAERRAKSQGGTH